MRLAAGLRDTAPSALASFAAERVRGNIVSGVVGSDKNVVRAIAALQDAFLPRHHVTVTPRE